MNPLILEGIGEKLEDTLQEQGLGHLHVRKHGTPLGHLLDGRRRTNQSCSLFLGKEGPSLSAWRVPAHPVVGWGR
ncbi:MAG: hypothetical protein K0R57_2763 [Paenibacillaceae bacterium]|jgi:hypothetical protein|nr:hypothetical protein [Paenibacillaceae bacterium]